MPKKNSKASGELCRISWIVVNVDDEREDVAGLSAIELGVYVRLKLLYLQRKGPLLPDVDEIYRLVGTFDRSERKAVDRVLSKKFEPTADGCWRSPACDAAIEDANRRYLNKSTAGKKGGDTKWGNPTGVDSTAIATLYGCHKHSDTVKEVKEVNSQDLYIRTTTNPSLSQEGEKGNDKVVVPAPPNPQRVGADKEPPPSSSTPHVCSTPSDSEQTGSVPEANVPRNTTASTPWEKMGLDYKAWYERTDTGYSRSHEEVEAERVRQSVTDGTMFPA